MRIRPELRGPRLLREEMLGSVRRQFSIPSGNWGDVSQNRSRTGLGVGTRKPPLAVFVRKCQTRARELLVQLICRSYVGDGHPRLTEVHGDNTHIRNR